MATSHIYLLISITICIICILPMMWLPVYKAEPDDAASAEVMYYKRLAAERTIQAKYEYAAWRMRPVRKSIMSLLQPAAPLTLWCDEPNWWDGVEPAVTPEEMLAKLAALEMNTPVEDDHALVWYPDENHWEQLPGDWDPLVSGHEDWLIAEEEMPEDDHALVWYPDENHWE